MRHCFFDRKDSFPWLRQPAWVQARGWRLLGSTQESIDEWHWSLGSSIKQVASQDHVTAEFSNPCIIWFLSAAQSEPNGHQFFASAAFRQTASFLNKNHACIHSDLWKWRRCRVLTSMSSSAALCFSSWSRILIWSPACWRSPDADADSPNQRA